MLYYVSVMKESVLFSLKFTFLLTSFFKQIVFKILLWYMNV